MFGLLMAVEILVSILLMIAILMQSSKGGGLAGSFGTGGMGTVFGVRRTADFLSRATTYLAVAFLGLALIINIFFLPGRQEGRESIIQRTDAPLASPRALPPAESKPAATPAQAPAK
jgi:preprotein translocase subunit SecG